MYIAYMDDDVTCMDRLHYAWDFRPKYQLEMRDDLAAWVMEPGGTTKHACNSISIVWSFFFNICWKTQQKWNPAFSYLCTYFVILLRRRLIPTALLSHQCSLPITSIHPTISVVFGDALDKINPNLKLF
jgi:hypothetical protein